MPTKATDKKHGKKLVIVESPSKIKSISGYLGEGFQVAASMGHIRDLPQPSDLPAELKKSSVGKFAVDLDKDFEPYYVRVGDRWTKIDYSQPAETWMEPLVRGRETDLVEIPANWYLDDLPPMMFVKTSPNSHGFVNPRDIEQMWIDQFDWVYREQDYAAFTMTIHPDVSGRPQVLMALERIIAHIKGHDGVRWVTFDEIAQDFLRRSPRPA